MNNRNIEVQELTFSATIFLYSTWTWWWILSMRLIQMPRKSFDMTFIKNCNVDRFDTLDTLTSDHVTMSTQMEQPSWFQMQLKCLAVYVPDFRRDISIGQVTLSILFSSHNHVHLLRWMPIKVLQSNNVLFWIRFSPFLENSGAKRGPHFSSDFFSSMAATFFTSR